MIIVLFLGCLGIVIEACPRSSSTTTVTADMLLEPDGHMSLLCTTDQVCNKCIDVEDMNSIPLYLNISMLVKISSLVVHYEFISKLFPADFLGREPLSLNWAENLGGWSLDGGEQRGMCEKM